MSSSSIYHTNTAAASAAAAAAAAANNNSTLSLNLLSSHVNGTATLLPGTGSGHNSGNNTPRGSLIGLGGGGLLDLNSYYMPSANGTTPNHNSAFAAATAAAALAAAATAQPSSDLFAPPTPATAAGANFQTPNTYHRKLLQQQQQQQQHHAQHHHQQPQSTTHSASAAAAAAAAAATSASVSTSSAFSVDNGFEFQFPGLSEFTDPNSQIDPTTYPLTPGANAAVPEVESGTPRLFKVTAAASASTSSSHSTAIGQSSSSMGGAHDIPVPAASPYTRTGALNHNASASPFAYQQQSSAGAPSALDAPLMPSASPTAGRPGFNTNAMIQAALSSATAKALEMVNRQPGSSSSAAAAAAAAAAALPLPPLPPAGSFGVKFTPQQQQNLQQNINVHHSLHGSGGGGSSNNLSTYDDDDGDDDGVPGSNKRKAQRNKPVDRTAVACLPCSRSKVKCDHERPCGRCVKRGMTDQCVDRVHRPMGRPPKKQKDVDMNGNPIFHPSPYTGLPTGFAGPILPPSHPHYRLYQQQQLQYQAQAAMAAGYAQQYHQRRSPTHMDGESPHSPNGLFAVPYSQSTTGAMSAAAAAASNPYYQAMTRTNTGGGGSPRAGYLPDETLGGFGHGDGSDEDDVNNANGMALLLEKDAERVYESGFVRTNTTDLMARLQRKRAALSVSNWVDRSLQGVTEDMSKLFVSEVTKYKCSMLYSSSQVFAFHLNLYDTAMRHMLSREHYARVHAHIMSNAPPQIAKNLHQLPAYKFQWVNQLQPERDPTWELPIAMLRHTPFSFANRNFQSAVFMNQAAQQLTGYTTQEYIDLFKGQPVTFKLYHPNDWGKLMGFEMIALDTTVPATMQAHEEKEKADADAAAAITAANAAAAAAATQRPTSTPAPTPAVAGAAATSVGGLAPLPPLMPTVAAAAAAISQPKADSGPAGRHPLPVVWSGERGILIGEAAASEARAEKVRLPIEPNSAASERVHQQAAAAAAAAGGLSPTSIGSSSPTGITRMSTGSSSGSSTGSISPPLLSSGPKTPPAPSMDSHSHSSILDSKIGLGASASASSSSASMSSLGGGSLSAAQWRAAHHTAAAHASASSLSTSAEAQHAAAVAAGEHSFPGTKSIIIPGMTATPESVELRALVNIVHKSGRLIPAILQSKITLDVLRLPSIVICLMPVPDS